MCQWELFVHFILSELNKYIIMSENSAKMMNIMGRFEHIVKMAGMKEYFNTQIPRSR